MSQKEAKARIKINKLLEESNWRLLDTPAAKANVAFENNVKITKKLLNELGEDYEKVSKGFIDYLLLDDNGHPVCVLEAKSEDKHPLVGKEQARNYANSKGVRFIILSNGNIHYFWDKETGNPTAISRFPKLESLSEQHTFNPNPDVLYSYNVKKDFIVLTKYPYYNLEPLYVSESTHDKYISDHNFTFLRDYQLEAIRTLQSAVNEGKNRFLFEMATGTGKTLISAAVIKLFLKTGNASRVLFLVDRLELETQAKKNFDKYLLPDYISCIFKEKKEDWRSADIVVTTIQSISYDNKYLKLFSPFDFDLIISDEAHRSISGNNRSIFEYFIGYKLGLTATPKDYLKNLNIDETDPRDLERRILLSTYKTFGCESEIPTFRYSLQQGVEDGYLVNPIAVDCRTDVTTQLLSKDGYAVPVESGSEDEEEAIFTKRDFEKTFFSENTNHEFVKTFMLNALKDPISGEIGKTICFCVSRRHARKITQILNEYAHSMFPGKYNSDFAIQVTSDIQNAQQFTVNFAYNNLNGHTSFLESYKSSKARVCVTVGMMTTGYDCEDILNICLMRPIFSPTDFVQIRGRGTRKFKFRYKGLNHNSEIVIDKSDFKLFDFFANCEYFENDFPYDDFIDLPPERGKGPNPPPPPPPPPESVEIKVPDPLKTIEVLTFEGNIMRIDKELYSSKFETKVKETYDAIPEFKEAVDLGDYNEMEKIVKEKLFDKPEEYFNLEKLRQSYNIDRRLTLWEILDKIFGKLKFFKSKEELVEDEFEKFKLQYTITPNIYYDVKEFFKLYVMDEEARAKINKQDYQYFSVNPVMFQMMQNLGSERLQQIPLYIKDNVNINNFM